MQIDFLLTKFINSNIDKTDGGCRLLCKSWQNVVGGDINTKGLLIPELICVVCFNWIQIVFLFVVGFFRFEIKNQIAAVWHAYFVDQEFVILWFMKFTLPQTLIYLHSSNNSGDLLHKLYF